MSIADIETLFRQAPMTAQAYMTHAIRDIDGLLGVGYAVKHPELIGAYMQTAAADFNFAVLAKVLLANVTEE